MPNEKPLGLEILKGSFRANSNKILDSIVAKKKKRIGNCHRLGAGAEINYKKDTKELLKVMKTFCILIMVVLKLIQEYAFNGYSLSYINYVVITWIKWGEI